MGGKDSKLLPAKEDPTAQRAPLKRGPLESQAPSREAVAAKYALPMSPGIFIGIRVDRPWEPQQDRV